MNGFIMLKVTNSLQVRYFFLVAELVAWNPVGDQYVIGYETTLSICDVQASNMFIIDLTCAILHIKIK